MRWPLREAPMRYRISMPASHAAVPHAIVHVVDSLEFGGLERVVADLAVAQARRGHRVHVFSIQDTHGLRAELERAGIPVVQGGKRSGLDPALVLRLRALVRGLGGCIVHTHNFVPNYYAAMAVVGLRGAVLVNTCHNMGARLRAPRLRLLYRASLLRTRRVAMVGRQVEERLTKLGIAPRGRTEVVPNGIPLTRHERLPGARERARTVLALPDDALVIGCVGRLVELKNHRVLIAQLPALAADFPQLRLVLLGDGPLAPALRAQAAALGAADRVVMPGARDDVHALLPGFDVFALPSHTEGLSIALLEACAAGLPIVASRVGGNPEIVVEDVTGRLFDPDDGAALQPILSTLLADPALRARLGHAARVWVEENGSVEVMCDKYDGVYARARGETRD
jgi:glycosyltransferase involved in cell wall biosynthesis